MIGGGSPILILYVSLLTNIGICYNVWKLIWQFLVIDQKTNFCFDKLILSLFQVDCVSCYLILLCGTPTLKGKNWTENVQKYLIKFVF